MPVGESAMIQMSVTDAQQRLPELLAAASAGETVEITQNGAAYRLTPIAQRPRPPVTGVPKAGRLKGMYVVPDDFDEPLENCASTWNETVLDTHALLWFQTDDPKLSCIAKNSIEDPANERWLSPMSLLEIALKNRLGQAAIARAIRLDVSVVISHPRHPPVAHRSAAHRTSDDIAVSSQEPV